MICWIDWDYPQSAVTLNIYRVGRSVPIRSRNPNKYRVKIQLLTLIGHFGPVSERVWPPMGRSDRSDRGAGLPGGRNSSSGVQIGRSIYAFRSSRRDLCNGAVQLAIWYCYPNRSDWFTWPVWPVRPDCPANSVFANFGCHHMPPYFLEKLVYQETSLKAQNFTKTMRITRANHVLLSRAILYIGHIIWFCSIS